LEAERLPAVLAAHPYQPGGDRGPVRAWIDAAWDYAVDFVAEAVTAESAGRTATRFEPRADGTLAVYCRTKLGPVKTPHDLSGSSWESTTALVRAGFFPRPCPLARSAAVGPGRGQAKERQET
jgi:hypothetical protein